MEKKNNALKIFWLIIPIALALGLTAIFDKKNLTASDIYLFALFLTLGLCAWVYVSFRAINFRKKLVYFIKRILENEYHSGIKINPKLNDEITGLEKLVNMMADQLRSYDELQVDKISALNRAIDIIYHNVKQGLILYDLTKKSFQINPAVQAVYEVEQENFSYDSLAKQEPNREFISLLQDSVGQGKITRDQNVTLELPIRQSKRDLRLTIIPIKDKNEIVELAVILVNQQHA